MRYEEAVKVILQANDEGQEHPCEQGHFDCASEPGGGCTNEAIATLMGYESGEDFLRGVGFDVDYWLEA